MERSRKRWILVSAILGSSMAFIDGSVVNVALPAIQSNLDADVNQLQWVINAYMLFLGALLLTGGAAGDLVGRRRIFVLGNAIFVSASLWCGLAPSIDQLILARGVQGVGAALLVPMSLALITESFPSGERGQAIGTWAGAAAITTALGPILGGWLVDSFSWRPIFFINVPIGAITIALSYRFVPRSAPHKTARLDWPGALLATGALGALTFAMIEGSDLGWTSRVILGNLAGSVLLGWLFLIRERAAARPMLPLSLFGSATFTGANVLTLLLYGALSGALFLVPLNLIQVQGYSATAAGASFLPLTITIGFLSRWMGNLAERIGPRPLLITGPIVAGAGVFTFSFMGTASSYWSIVFPAMLMLGLGMAISVAPLTNAVMSSVDDERAGVASGINNSASRVAGLVAVALLGSIAVSSFTAKMDADLDSIALPPAVERSLTDQLQRLGGIEIDPSLDEETRTKVRQIVDENFAASFRLVMWITAALSAAGALVTFVWIRPEQG